MICASCGTTNTNDASFCNNCGQSLASGCPQCGTDNPPQAYRHAMSADHTEAVPHSFLFDTPIFAALRLRDPDRIRTAKAIFPIGAGPRFDSLAAVAEASLDVLEQGSEEAIKEFISTAEQHGTVDGGVETAKLKAILAELIPDSPLAREAGREALDWFTDHGAKGYVAVFAPVWEAIGVEEART